MLNPLIELVRTCEACLPGGPDFEELQDALEDMELWPGDQHWTVTNFQIKVDSIRSIAQDLIWNPLVTLWRIHVLGHQD